MATPNTVTRKSHERRWRLDAAIAAPLVDQPPAALLSTPAPFEDWDTPASAVVRLLACRHGENTPRSAGTGVLVRPDLIVTAAHVIFDPSVQVFGMNRQGYAGSVFVDAPWTAAGGVWSGRLVAANGWTLKGRRDFDVGLVRLDQPWQGDAVPLAPAALGENAWLQSELRLYGIPAGSNQLHAGQGGCTGVQPGLIFHTAHATGGMSGGPLLADVGGEILFGGIHRAGVGETPSQYCAANGAVRLTSALAGWIFKQGAVL
jgi:V8-like Glu-specific endopeptidase